MALVPAPTYLLIGASYTCAFRPCRWIDRRGQGLLKFQMQTGAVGHGEFFFLSFGMWDRTCEDRAGWVADPLVSIPSRFYLNWLTARRGAAWCHLSCFMCHFSNPFPWLWGMLCHAWYVLWRPLIFEAQGNTHFPSRLPNPGYMISTFVCFLIFALGLSEWEHLGIFPRRKWLTTNANAAVTNYQDCGRINGARWGGGQRWRGGAFIFPSVSNDVFISVPGDSFLRIVLRPRELDDPLRIPPQEGRRPNILPVRCWSAFFYLG